MTDHDSSTGSIDSPRHPKTSPAGGPDPSTTVDTVSIAQRDDLLEHGRQDIAERLAKTEALEAHRENELLRLQSANRKLLSANKVLEEEVAHWKRGFSEAREQAEQHVQAEIKRWQQQVVDVEKAKSDVERRYQSVQDEVSNLRSQLLDVRARNDDLAGKTRVQERLMEDYKLEVQKSRSGAEDDLYIQSLRAKLSDRDCVISEWKERCAKSEGELQQARSNVLVLNQQIQILGQEKSRYEREVSDWEARRKSGGIIDASALAQQQNDREQLREELSMVHATNTRLLAMMKQSKELNQFIRSLPDDAAAFYYCGPAIQEETSSPLLMMLSSQNPQGTAGSTRNDSLRLALEAHNVSSRSRHLATKPGQEEKLAAAAGVPIQQQREKDYWVPKEVFAKAGEFRTQYCPSTAALTDDSFYKFLVDLNRIWYERMKNRTYAMGSCSKSQQDKTPDQPRCASCRPKGASTRQLTTLHAQLLALRKESHAVAAKNVAVHKVLGMYDRLCETAISEKSKAESTSRTLREEIQCMLSSRDPHVIELKNTLWKLVSDSQRTGTRLTTQLGHLLVEYERTVDMMQLTDSFRAFFSSFSQTVREVMTSEVDMLKQCASEAGARHDEVCHYQVPERVCQSDIPERRQTRADPGALAPGDFQPSRYY